jgi:pyridinium-3,5-bisthiocarboxylic acid mononucleotide nickel chelatase
LPVPTPATVEMLRDFEVVAGDGAGEMVTPTGAAILCALATPMRPTFRLRASGNGAGTRRLADRPNVLRVLIGDCDARADETLAMIEADIDDMTPAALAHVAERLRTSGARDVTLAPIMMKKGRVGLRLTVLCDLADVRRLASVALAESSTIGLRYRACDRVVLARRIEVVETDFGPIAIKIVERPGGGETAEPELDDVVRASVTAGKPLAEVRAAALAAWTRKRT